MKRYDLVGDMDGNCNLNEARMESSSDGVYVKYRDVEELEAENARLRQQRDAANALLDYVLEEVSNETE